MSTLRKSRTDLIVKATWSYDHVMVFGNSYKKWWVQMREYMSTQQIDYLPEIMVANEPWINFGGLKWCEWNLFQSALNEEGMNRQVCDFRFRKPHIIELNCLKSIKRSSVTK